MAVADELVVAIGTVPELTDRFPDAPVVDFGEATIVPGFNDGHAHIAMTAEDILHSDLSYDAVKTMDELLTAVTEAARETPDGEWVRGSRFDDQKTGMFTRDDLDRVVPGHPVLVTHVAGHWGVVNSKALELLGIDESSEDPPGGQYDRYPDGRLNGRLVERALMNVSLPATAHEGPGVPASSFADLQRGVAKVIRRWNAAGLTSVCDALVGPDDVRMFSAARHAGNLTMRIGMLLSIDHYDKAVQLGVGSGFGDDYLRLVGVKAFLDGAIGGRTCLLSEPFTGTDYRGLQTTSTDDLNRNVARVHADGNRIGVHANGDEAIRLVLDAFETAQREMPRPGLRHRIEHCSVIDDEIVARMKALDAIAVPFAGYAAYHGGALNGWYGEERTSRMFAHRTLLDAGLTVAASSDYPCGPFQPLVGMQSMVTRTGMDDGAVVGGNQRISAAEALKVFTIGSADASGDAAVKGRLAPGYLADFTVLGENPLEADPMGIADIDVEATYVGGTVVHER
nr:amidohydrolase [Spelaeicoccus albus]